MPKEKKKAVQVMFVAIPVANIYMSAISCSSADFLVLIQQHLEVMLL